MQQPPAPPPAPPPPSVEISHEPAHGKVGEHDRLDFGAGGYINAYPFWPPRGEPTFLVIHYNNGDTVWGEPSYSAPDCPDFTHCRRATFRINPTWKNGEPHGQLYEVVTLDGRPVLNSVVLQVIDPQTTTTAYVVSDHGVWFAGASLRDIFAQSQAAKATGQQAAPSATPVSQGADSGSAWAAGAQAFGSALGVTMAAAFALGAAYLEAREQNLAYRAQSIPLSCTTTHTGVFWNTRCQ